MDRSTRRKVLRLCGVSVAGGLAGCSGVLGGDDEENDIKDTDGDGVIDSEDYAPRDPDVQRREQVVDNSTPRETEQPTESVDNSLVLRAPLDGNTVMNRASRQPDLSLSAYNSPTTGVSGRFDSAWLFDRNLSGTGPDAVVFDIPEERDFDFSGSYDFSVKAHFNPNTESIDGPAPRQGNKDHPNPFLFHARGNPAEISIQFNDDGDGKIRLRIESADRDSSIFNTAGVSAPVGEWTSFVLTWDSSNNEANLYINGQKELTESAGTPFSTATDSSTISGFGARAGRGGRGRGDKGFDGRMDELQIYDTTLTEEQARTLHTQATF